MRQAPDKSVLQSVSARRKMLLTPQYRLHSEFAFRGLPTPGYRRRFCFTFFRSLLIRFRSLLIRQGLALLRE